jgi:hypothetical protein
MKTHLLLFFILLSGLVLKAQDLSFEDIKNCSKKDYQKAFIASLLEKKFVLLKQDSTKNGKAAYYAFKKDSSELLITIHSYNMVDFRFTSSKNKLFVTLNKEKPSGIGNGCWGTSFSKLIKSASYNASVVDYKTKVIVYSEEANPATYHIIMVSPYSDVVKVKHSKQEGINCSEWYSVCVEPGK